MDEAEQIDGNKIKKIEKYLNIFLMVSKLIKKKMEIWSLLFGAGKGT
tara:strand:- start:22 stop:162 length:141 start_codon:yes stop_codon:yes gene_type:complete